MRVPSSLLKDLAQIDLASYDLRGDIALAGTSRGHAVELHGSLGTARASVLADIDLAELRAARLVTAEAPNSRRAPSSRRSQAARTAAAGCLESSRAWRAATGSTATTLVAVNATPAIAHAVGVASVDSPYGHADAQFVADGPLSPKPNLVASGTIDGQRLHYDDIRVGSAVVRFDAKDLPARPSSSRRVREWHSPGQLPRAECVPHHDDDDRRDLDRHRARRSSHRDGRGRTLAGSGGHVTITDGSIAVTALRTGTAGSELTANALVSRTTEDLAGSVTAKNIALSMLDPSYRGTVAANLSVARNAGVWSGGGTIDARGVTLPDQPTVDGKVTSRSRIAGSPCRQRDEHRRHGRDRRRCDGPARRHRSAAWRHLQRSSITRASITLTGIDAHAADPKLTGTLEGEVSLAATDAQGALHVRGVQTEAGTIAGDIEISTAARPVRSSRTRRRRSPTFRPRPSTRTILLPTNPFDPVAWQKLRNGALREATITGELAVDPALLARFGIDAKISGNAKTKLTRRAGRPDRATSRST